MEHQRIQRGMIFWYNRHPECDNGEKARNHIVQYEGKEYEDRTIYGRRPWIVLSNDHLNKAGNLCIIAPMSNSHIDTKVIPTHVKFRINSETESTVLLDQLITVNQYELKEYFSMATEESLKKIDKGLDCLFGAQRKDCCPEVRDAG